MKVFRAMAAGVAGALTMSAAMFLLRALGVNISLEALLGSLFQDHGIVSAWMLGFLLHLALGALAALFYSAAFELAVQRAGPWVGGGFGLAHGMMAGLFMSAIPAMNPLTSDSGAAPGPFLSNMKFGPVLFLLLHFLYGAVVGVAYGKPRQKPHLYTNLPAGSRGIHMTR